MRGEDNMKLLLIIDAQEGFMNEENRKITNDIIEHVKNEEYNLIIATRFINKIDSLYNKDSYRREITMLSSKAKLVEGIGELADITIMKSTYTALTTDLDKLLKKNEVKEVYLSGFNIESSIIATAFGLFDEDIKPIILSKLCGTMREDTFKQNALMILGNTIGKDNIL